MASEAEKKDFLHYYKEYKDKIYSYIWYRVGFNAALAEDLTSEIFIKALENFERFDQARSFQAWIYRIAHNHLINHYKVSNRETELEAADKCFDEPLELLDTMIDHERVMLCINDMPDSSKQALLLRYAEEMSNEEIAAILDKDVGAIRTQLSRAMAELRKRLANLNQ